MAEFLRRNERHQAGGIPLLPPGECELSRAYPALVEFLSLREWEPGVARTTGTILIVIDGGLWKGWLNDRDVLRAAWLSASTLTGLLAAAEGGLREDGLEWRDNSGSKSGGARRRT